MGLCLDWTGGNAFAVWSREKMDWGWKMDWGECICCLVIWKDDRALHGLAQRSSDWMLRPFSLRAARTVYIYTTRVGQSRIGTVYNRVFGDFPARNTIYILYIYTSHHHIYTSHIYMCVWIVLVNPIFAFVLWSITATLDHCCEWSIYHCCEYTLSLLWVEHLSLLWVEHLSLLWIHFITAVNTLITAVNTLYHCCEWSIYHCCKYT